jgi:hypothetical protein
LPALASASGVRAVSGKGQEGASGMTMATVENGHGHRQRWTLERWITVLTFVATLVTLAFTGGVSWARVTSLEQKQGEHERHAQAQFQDFVRKDVMEKELARIYDKLEDLEEKLDRMQR